MNRDAVDAPEPHEVNREEREPTIGKLMTLTGRTTRGPARRTAQLSRDQKHIIRWLLLQAFDRVTTKTGRRRHSYASIAHVWVAWHAKKCFEGEEVTPSRRAAISRSLRRLRERGLIEVIAPELEYASQKRRATRLRLTSFGWQEFLNRPAERAKRRDKNRFFGNPDRHSGWGDE